jgi:HEAT repeat protein
MRGRSTIALTILLGVCCAGCGKTSPLAGGKPVSHWVAALRDPDAKVRKKAASKLGNVGTADAAALPALMGALEDRDAAVRCEAILALVKFGPAAKDAIPILTELHKKDRDAKVRAYASKALEKLQDKR